MRVYLSFVQFLPHYVNGPIDVSMTAQPYITKAIFSTPDPPVNLRKIAIGDGAMGSFAGYEEISTVCLFLVATGGVIISHLIISKGEHA